MKKIGKYTQLFVALATAMLVFHSCLEDEVIDTTKSDFDTFELPFNIAFPMVKGTIMFKDIIEEADIEGLKVFEGGNLDGVVYFDFDTKINVGRIVDVEVPDQSIKEFILPEDIVLPEFIPVSPGDSFQYSREIRFEIDVEGGEIDKAVFEEGNLDVFANNILGDGIPGIEQRLKIQFLDLSLDNRLFEETLYNDDFGVKQEFELDNYTLVTSGSEGEYIRAIISYTIKNTGAALALIPAPKTLYFEFNMTNVKPRFVTGYFGQRILFEGNSIVEIPYLDTEIFEDGTLFFKDPRLSINLINPVGMPFTVNLYKINLINSDKNDSIKMEFDRNSFFVDAGTPTFINGTDVNIEVEEYFYLFDTLNSNLSDIIGRVFDEVDLKYDVVANPKGRDSLDFDNVIRFDSSEILVETHAILPLWFKSDRYNRTDTLGFDFQEEVLDQDLDTATIDNLDSLTVILGLTNAFPIQLNGQIYITDENYNILDSVFTQAGGVFLNGPEVDANGRVLFDEEGMPISGDTKITLAVSPDKRNVWRPGKYLIFKLCGFTSDNDSPEQPRPFVRVREDNWINFYIGFTSGGKINNSVLESLND